eukprot:12989208-Alexandrium_andersonii.AAC.1
MPARVVSLGVQRWSFLVAAAAAAVAGAAAVAAAVAVVVAANGNDVVRIAPGRIELPRLGPLQPLRG